MPNRTIYIKDEDAPLFEDAKTLGGSSISAVITEALRDYVRSARAERREARTEEVSKELADRLLDQAVELGATDIHVEPGRDGGRVRMRIDGRLREVEQISDAVFEPLITEFLSRARLEGGADDFPSGRFTVVRDGVRQDLRLCALPTALGRCLTLRRLPGDLRIPEPEDLEPDGREAPELRRLAKLSHGLVCCTGPTGSGKTSTLYSMLQCVDRAALKVLTLEDPVEWLIDGCYQVPVKSAPGQSFAAAIPAVLSCDPDVVVVNEIRDAETARSCLEMSVTGHLVLTQLHAPTAVGALRRMLELGLPPFLVRDGVSAVIAQRLLRRLCPSCKHEDDSETGREGPFYTAPGCERCSGTGYRGRFCVFERLEPGRRLKALLMEDPSQAELEACARDEGLRTLPERALERARQGWTSLAEVLAAFPEA